MANPIPFPLPDRPEEFQIDRQWKENYDPALKYGAKIDSSQIIGGNITVEDTGLLVGVFDTLDFIGGTIVDNGDGSVSITYGAGAGVDIEDEGTSQGIFTIIDFVGAGVTAVNSGGGRATVTIPGGAGITTLTSVDGSVTLTPIVGGFDLSVNSSNIDWSVTNWSNFFTNVDWSQLTNWNDFITSVITNWTATNWNDFIDEFINNVDSDDVFNFLNQIAGTVKGDILVYNGSTWTLLNAGANGEVLSANSATATGLEYVASSTTTLNSNPITGFTASGTIESMYVQWPVEEGVVSGRDGWNIINGKSSVTNLENSGGATLEVDTPNSWGMKSDGNNIDFVPAFAAEFDVRIKTQLVNDIYSWGFATGPSSQIVDDAVATTGFARAVCFGVAGDGTLDTYAYAGDGVSGTLVNLGLSQFDVQHRYRIIWNTGVDAEFYIDGVLVATINTNLPGAGGVASWFMHSDAGSAGQVENVGSLVLNWERV